jgi:dipeptidyl-peptidase 4
VAQLRGDPLDAGGSGAGHADRALFDNDWLAAELTRITRDPWDGQNLPIRNLRFIERHVLEFEVQSSGGGVRGGGARRRRTRSTRRRTSRRKSHAAPPPALERKVHYFHYDTRTRELPSSRTTRPRTGTPGWASVSPDREWVVFSRAFNLWMMSYDDYHEDRRCAAGPGRSEAEDAEEAVEVDEIQLTTDGEEHYSYGNAGRGQTDVETAEEQEKPPVGRHHLVP